MKTETLRLNRLHRLRAELKARQLDTILVSESENRRYLSAFTGSEGWLLVTPNKALIIVDFRFVEQAKREAPDWEIFEVKGSPQAWFPGLVGDLELKHTAFEADCVSVSLHSQLTRTLKEKNVRCRLAASSALVEGLRTVKDREELGLVEMAVRLTDRAHEFARKLAKPGLSELELAWQLERFLRENGSESLPFPLIVASGANSALPHATPSARTLVEGEPVLVDMGARIGGYCSDMTRTFWLGQPNAEFGKLYQLVLAAQLAAIAIIQAGMTGQTADASARAVIAEAGFGDRFGHGLGHGVGLAVHEQPRLGPDSTDILAEGMVFTIEPGIYLSGWGGIRIEDMAMIEGGNVKVLSTASKYLDH